MIKNVAILLSLLIVAACGGGGGGGDDAGGIDPVSTVDPNREVSLAALQSLEPGIVYSTQLSGRDSYGTTYSGSLAMANRPQEMLDGVLVTPRDLMTSLLDSGASITVTASGYTDTHGNLVSFTIKPTGMVCTPITQSDMPESVKVGDFGVDGTLSCSDNSVQESNWRVADAGNGNIHIITSSAMKNNFNEVVSNTDVTFTLDANGRIVGFKTVTTQLDDGFTLTYGSV